MQLLLKLIINTFIIFMFFLANESVSPTGQQIFFTLGTMGLLQVSVLYYVWRSLLKETQDLNELERASFEFSKTRMYKSSVPGFIYSCLMAIILYLPRLIALDWIGFFSYGLGFISLFIILHNYFKVRGRVKEIRQKMTS